MATQFNSSGEVTMTAGTYWGIHAQTLGRAHAKVLYPTIAGHLQYASDETLQAFWTDYDNARHGRPSTHAESN